MDKQTLLQYCLDKAYTYLDFPFKGEDYAVVKVKNSENCKNRIFAEIFTLKGEDSFTFSTDENAALFLRETYPQTVSRGWHCPPAQAKYKSTVALKDFDDDVLKKFADMSYGRALSKL